MEKITLILPEKDPSVSAEQQYNKSHAPAKATRCSGDNNGFTLQPLFYRFAWPGSCTTEKEIKTRVKYYG